MIALSAAGRGSETRKRDDHAHQNFLKASRAALLVPDGFVRQFEGIIGLPTAPRAET
jgi:hypothetical protein